MVNLNEFKRAFETVVDVMREGERNHLPDEWKTYPPKFHASRATGHLRLWQAGDQSQDYLTSAVSDPD